MLQVVLGLNPGGTERLVVELASRLHAEIPMMVCCLEDKGEWAGELEARGIAVTPLRRREGFHPSLGYGVATAARRHGATVLHAHHYSPFVYSCVARAFRPTARVVFTEHGRLSDAAPSPKRRLANRLLARVPRRVFTVSRDLGDHLAAEGFPRTRLDVIYNGIDVGDLVTPEERSRVRRELGVEDDTLVIGTIARLDPVKDLGTLVRAVALLVPHTPVLVVIIGDGSEGESLRALVRNTGMCESVRFLGHRDDARSWLAGCDVYANSSISEGVSLTILEAMASSLPVVATRVGGTPEVVDDTCGQLVPVRSAAAFADAVLGLARDRNRRLALGRAARARVEARFTLARMVDEYRCVYLDQSPVG